MLIIQILVKLKVKEMQVLKTLTKTRIKFQTKIWKEINKIKWIILKKKMMIKIR